jgi:diaminopimelate epimerase
MKELKSYQCSERSGFMDITLLDKNKMLIKGKAQMVFRGELML